MATDPREPATIPAPVKHREPPAEPWCFGPQFFALQLSRFVRDHCPTAEESLPQVELHLASGQILDLCHVIGVAPGWVALAVFTGRRREGAPMRTELVPYGLITRVTVSQGPSSECAIGFDTGREPRVLDGGQDLGSPAGFVAALQGPRPEAGTG
jgi:hypothetical protein